MISLPEGFNYLQLLSDYFFCALPIISVNVAIFCYRIIRRGTDQI